MHMATNLSNGKIISFLLTSFFTNTSAPLEPIRRLLTIRLMGITKRAIGRHLITYISGLLFTCLGHFVVADKMSSLVSVHAQLACNFLTRFFCLPLPPH